LEKKLPEHVDPLIWWQMDARPFPTITSLAKTVLCVCLQLLCPVNASSAMLVTLSIS